MSSSLFTTDPGSFITNRGTPSVHYSVHSLQKSPYIHGHAHTFELQPSVSLSTNADPYRITECERGDVPNGPYHPWYDSRIQDNWFIDQEMLSAAITEEMLSCHPPLAAFAQSQDQASSHLSEVELQLYSSLCLGGDMSVTSNPPKQDIPVSSVHSIPAPVTVDDRSQLTDEQLRFIQQSFPQTSAEHVQQRDILGTVLLSPWLKANTFEPRNSGLLQHFLLHNDQTGRWECTFWKNNRRCPMSYTRKDQAISHIRVHINHSPYACKDSGPW